ncbi:hypothetical protein [Salinimicrobium oceani]|uniref:TPM domain-containing protein n=1 Tax=Salinimicrobium oceani TaxID=2722702 RepID=A0ABX1CXS5_9FLAO|nr:hypothetical protein [Salinimicrobium oceani]NJW53080.1 hypothetical protein [Salinimicrobium oceani]
MKSFFLLFLLVLSAGCENSKEDGLLKNALAADRDWKKVSTENFILYAPLESPAAKKLSAFGIDAEAARLQVMEQLQVVKQEESAVLIFTTSPEEMLQFSGVRTSGRAVIDENGIFFLAETFSAPAFKKELGRLYSWRSWGKPSNFWFDEGMAVYAAGDCAGEDLHAWVSKLASENKLTDFSELEAEKEGYPSYTSIQAGSFVKYLMEKYGILSFRMF